VQDPERFHTLCGDVNEGRAWGSCALRVGGDVRVPFWLICGCDSWGWGGERFRGVTTVLGNVWLCLLAGA
jgi:hypothetical protein